MKTFLTLTAAVLLAVSVAACDSGGDPVPPAPPPVDCVPGMDNNCE